MSTVYLGRCLGHCIYECTRYVLESLGDIELAKSTTIFIGFLNLIGNITLVVFTCFTLGTGAAILNEGVDKTHHDGVVIIAAFGVFLLVFILSTAFAIGLLVGLHQDKAGHLRAYRIYGSLLTVLIPIFIIINIVKKDIGRIPIYHFFLQVIFLFFTIYFVRVIKNQYKRIKHPEPACEPTVDDTA